MAQVRVLWTSATANVAGQIRVQGKETEVEDHQAQWLLENGYCKVAKSPTSKVVPTPDPTLVPKDGSKPEGEK